MKHDVPRPMREQDCDALVPDSVALPREENRVVEAPLLRDPEHARNRDDPHAATITNAEQVAAVEMDVAAGIGIAAR